MKRVLIILLALAWLSEGTALAGPLNIRGRSALPAFRLPQVKVTRLANGILCFLKEDHTLPLVKVKAIARAGSIYDPADEVGLSLLTGALMRSGGAGDRTPAAFDATVDGLGAILSSGIGAEMGEFGLEILSEDLQAGMGLFFDMLFAPRFDPERLRVARLKIEEQLRREDDDPGRLASRRFRELAYGKENVWARRPSRKSLARVAREDVAALHRRVLTTDNLILAAAGDFDAKAFVALVEGLTRDAPRGEASLPPVPEVPLAFAPGREEVVRPLTQAFIRIGHLGIRRHNPDKFALLLVSDILGAGSFKSRLMEDIRTRRGMAYNIWSDMTPGTDYGLFTVGVATKAAQAGEVVDLIRGHIERLAVAGDVTDEELEFARQSILSQLVFEFDSAFKVVSRRAAFRFYGYPDDYWRVFRDRIARVTRADVAGAAHRYLHPEGLKVVVVGPKTKER